jgi:hypothetical protein
MTVGKSNFEPLKLGSENWKVCFLAMEPPLGPVHCKKIRLTDFTNFWHPQGSDFAISVQVRVHPGQRDYDQSFIPTPENREIGFNFLTMDTTILYIIIDM